MHGTNEALRRTRRADGRTQLHHRLIEVAGTLAIQQTSARCHADFLPTLRRSRRCKHALNVAVNNSNRLHRRRCWQWPQRCIGRCQAGPATLPQYAEILRRARAQRSFRRLMHSARAMVIAEAAPCRQHRTLASRGQHLHRRKTLHETRIVIQHGSHTRLLQHDFGNPNSIGIAIAAPWQLAAMLVIPAQQSATERTRFVPD